MARFDPDSYPDRLAFEANARRIRSDEIANAFAASVTLLAGWQQELAHRLGKFVAAAIAQSHRHSTG